MKRLKDQHNTLRIKMQDKGVQFDGPPLSGYRELVSTGRDKHGRKVRFSTHWDGGTDVYDRVPGHLKEEAKARPIHVLPMAARVGPSRGHEHAVDYSRGEARKRGHHHVILLGSKANPIPAEHKRKIFQRTFGGRVEVMHPNMVDHIRGLAAKHREVHIYASDDDEAPGKASRHEEYKRMFKDLPNVHAHPIKRVADQSGEAFRGRHMRHAAETGDFQTYARMFAKRADRQTIKDTYKAVRKGMLKEATVRPGESLDDHAKWMGKVKAKYSGQFKSIGQPKPRPNGGHETHFELWHGQKMKAISTAHGHVCIDASEHYLTPRRGFMGRKTNTFMEGDVVRPTFGNNATAAEKKVQGYRSGSVTRLPSIRDRSTHDNVVAHLGKTKKFGGFVKQKAGVDQDGNPTTDFAHPKTGQRMRLTTTGNKWNMRDLKEGVVILEGSVVDFPKDKVVRTVDPRPKKFKTKVMNAVGMLDKEQRGRVRKAYVDDGMSRSQINTRNPDLPKSGIHSTIIRKRDKWNRGQLDEVGDTAAGRARLSAYKDKAEKQSDSNYRMGYRLAKTGDVDTATTYMKRGHKRDQGADRAKARLGVNEVSQVDETSVKKYAAYIKAASDNMAGHSFDAGSASSGGSAKDREVYDRGARKATKRMHGIVRATDGIKKKAGHIDEARRSSTGNDASDDPYHAIMALRKAAMNRAGGHAVQWENGKQSKIHPGHINRALDIHDELKKAGHPRHVNQNFVKRLGKSESDFYETLAAAEDYLRERKGQK